MKAKIRGTEIYFDIAGMQLAPYKKYFIEKPMLFMLHGGPGSDHLPFKQHSLELEQTAQLVFIDHRGCGRSKKTKQNEYTLENNIEDIEALRKYLGLGRISILGTSYGGIVAQGYAIRYLKNLDKLVLVSTAPSFRFIEEAKNILQDRGTVKQIAACEHLWNGTFKNSQHVTEFFKLMESLYLISNKKNQKQALSPTKTIWSHQALNQGFGDFLQHFDYISKLKKITCPTLIIAGEKDWICNSTQSKIIAQEIPHSRLKVFKNCGHAVAVDAHDQYIKIIKNFLKHKTVKNLRTTR
jgi:proline iminopeptidase